jgi:hypothetical protein
MDTLIVLQWNEPDLYTLEPTPNNAAAVAEVLRHVDDGLGGSWTAINRLTTAIDALKEAPESDPPMRKIKVWPSQLLSLDYFRTLVTAAAAVEHWQTRGRWTTFIGPLNALEDARRCYEYFNELQDKWGAWLHSVVKLTAHLSPRP